MIRSVPSFSVWDLACFGQCRQLKSKKLIPSKALFEKPQVVGENIYNFSYGCNTFSVYVFYSFRNFAQDV